MGPGTEDGGTHRGTVPQRIRCKEGVCTLALLHNLHDRFPIILIGNREEQYARPSTPPQVLAEWDQGERSVGPRDEVLGGTWFGINSRGLSAAMTNQDDWFEVNARGRGKAMAHCLRHATAGGATRFLQALDPDLYNPFNVIFGRPGNMKLARIHRSGVTIQKLELGTVTVVSNDSGGADYQAKECHLRERIAELPRSSDVTEILAFVLQVMSSHQNEVGKEHSQLCAHGERWGTKSTSVILAGSAYESARLFYSDGPPCQSKGFGEYTYLIGT